MGKRLDNIIVRGKPLDASRRYKVASWAPVAEGASGKAIWDVVIPYLRTQKTIRAPKPNRPALVGAIGNSGTDPELRFRVSKRKRGLSRFRS